MKAVIIAHGDAIEDEILSREIKSADYVICADGGAEYAFGKGITPDYLLGDFDSIDEEIYSHYQNENVLIEKFPIEKDYTDTEICMKKAIDLGCTEIAIISGVGSRIDHSLGNIGLLHVCSSNGIKGYIVSKNATIYHSKSEITFEGSMGDTISIIPINGDASGISTFGLKYSLENAAIKFGSPLGISNVMIGDKCKVTIKQGEILVIKQIID